uniref:Uncharacterized protein n=1 Tax=Trichuris muris TaxID=70415 RepID=A0A5S6Q398_TRIMR
MIFSCRLVSLFVYEEVRVIGEPEHNLFMSSSRSCIFVVPEIVRNNALPADGWDDLVPSSATYVMRV